MRILASASDVRRQTADLRRGDPAGGRWIERYVDPATGQRWSLTYLWPGTHGGGQAILVREPVPTRDELLELANTSDEPAEIAASLQLLAELDEDGAYKEELIASAERVAVQGDQERAVLLVGWGGLDDESNLRPTRGKTSSQVTADHDHFRAIAARARALLARAPVGTRLRDARIFEA